MKASTHQLFVCSLALKLEDLLGEQRSGGHFELLLLLLLAI
jgi:hypothetical protein